MTEVMLSHKRHRADTWVDRIEITTEPRWKTSGLSGDEWRFSYTVTLWRKGWKVAEEGFGSLAYATAWANLQSAGGFCPASQPWPADAPARPYGDGYLCDNPGCPTVATWRGVLKAIYGRNGEGPLEQYGTYFRVFCDLHKDRGDCAMEDCTDNYTWTPIEVTS